MKALVAAKCLMVAFVTPLVFGQGPPTRTHTKPPVNETLGVNRPQIGILVPRTSTVPLLFGMNRVEVARVLEPLRVKPSFSGIENGVAIDQKPEAGVSVRWGSAVAVILGEMPRLVLSGPPAPAYAGSELTFTAAFVPPLPAGVKVGFYFVWGDGSRAESTANAVVTHRFADAGNRVVSVVGIIDGRFKIGGRVPVDVLASPPPTDTTPTATDVTTTTSDTTATVATEGSTATEPTTTTESTTSSATTTTAPATTTTEPTTTTAPETITTETVPPPDPSSNLLVWIGAAAVVLLLVVTFLLARVLRALNRKEPQVQAKPAAVFNGGMRSIEYEIEHPELIRRMPEVGLRGGIRGEGDGDV